MQGYYISYHFHGIKIVYIMKMKFDLHFRNYGATSVLDERINRKILSFRYPCSIDSKNQFIQQIAVTWKGKNGKA